MNNLVDKEIEFNNGIDYLINKYPEKNIIEWYWKPQYYKNGFPIIKKSKQVKNISEFDKDIIRIHNYLENPRTHTKNEIEAYNKKVKEIIEKIGFKFNSNISKDIMQKQKYALARYYKVGALNNISLSVAPEIKKKWQINFELFGSFYNTNTNYCGLYGDLENNSCDFYTFRLKKNMRILINPPYTERWIKISCKTIENIMKKNMNTTIYLVIPVWNISDRKKLNLPIYEDLPEIDELKKSKYLISHELINLQFYNGIIKKNVNLKDKVHLFILSNDDE